MKTGSVLQCVTVSVDRMLLTWVAMPLVLTSTLILVWMDGL